MRKHFQNVLFILATYSIAIPLNLIAVPDSSTYKQSSHTLPQQKIKSIDDGILNPNSEFQKMKLEQDQLPSESDQDILHLFHEGMKYAHSIFLERLKENNENREVATEVFLKEIDAGLVIYRDSDLGDVEITQVDSKLAVRVHEYTTNENVVFLGTDLFSDHMKSFSSRLSWKKDSTFHKIENNKFAETLKFQTPKTIKEKLKKYWSGIYVKPDRKQTRFSVVLGSIQAALTVGFAQIFYYAGITNGIEPKVFLMSGVSLLLGTTFGIYGRTLKNFINGSKTPTSAFLKQLGISYFAKYLYYSLKYILIDKKGITPFFMLPGMNGKDIAQNVHVHISSNAFFSNLNRSAWFTLPGLFETMGKGRSTVKFKIFGKEFDLGINYNQLTFQLTYLIPFLMSKMDLIFNDELVKIPFSIPFMGDEIPAGRLFLLAGMVTALAMSEVALYGIKWYAGRNAEKRGDAVSIEFKNKVDTYIKSQNSARINSLKSIITSPFRAVAYLAKLPMRLLSKNKDSETTIVDLPGRDNFCKDVLGK